MDIVFGVVVAVVLLATYVTWLAGRLDRLHVRVEAARAALDAQLLRRSAVAAELAARASRRGLLDEPVVTALAGAARAARRPEAGEAEGDREGVENDLTRALRTALAALPDDEALAGHPDLGALLADLTTAVTRVALARTFYNGAVEDTRVLRQARLVRWFHLAGHAPAPPYFEIDDGQLPRAVPTRAGG